MRTSFASAVRQWRQSTEFPVDTLPYLPHCLIVRTEKPASLSERHRDSGLRMLSRICAKIDVLCSTNGSMLQLIQDSSLSTCTEMGFEYQKHRNSMPLVRHFFGFPLYFVCINFVLLDTLGSAGIHLSFFQCVALLESGQSTIRLSFVRRSPRCN